MNQLHRFFFRLDPLRTQAGLGSSEVPINIIVQLGKRPVKAIVSATVQELTVLEQCVVATLRLPEVRPARI